MSNRGECSMYDMYPADWPAIDGRERKAARRRKPSRPASAEVKAVQEAMNRRDNGGEPKK
ncbi:hypothetical protein HPO96_26650 [Kribbella sandramycini]|uniref:Uncharacterized protein n=1 Tax=Kribbella sandramycini TaxID=60450 RepID=A0A7Y4P2B6_9ACTN|nr:hypothetical protein [Kribbella sandramycini]MBB6570689.1 hypothetical protein [Kribbella sandramycini]NOL43833.1 hypothetical protein [Kribbella sandramycini]